MKIENGKKTKNYGKKLLQDFKTVWTLHKCWVQTMFYLESHLATREYSEKELFIFKTEMAYYCSYK